MHIFPCKYCSEIFMYEEDFFAHLRTSYYCIDCDRFYPKKCQKFHCKLCKHIHYYYTSIDLMNHIKMCHACNYCDKTFIWDWEKGEHENSHYIRQFVEFMCPWVITVTLIYITYRVIKYLLF